MESNNKSTFTPPYQPPFTGAKQDALAADNWLDYIEDLHAWYNADDDLAKVLMCKSYLQDEALRWYLRHDMETKSWAEFKTVFKQRFYPPHFYENEYLRFMRLKQIGSVESYNNAFNKSFDIVSKLYALPGLTLKRQYCQGLQRNIAMVVRPLLPLSHLSLEQIQLVAIEADIARKRD